MAAYPQTKISRLSTFTPDAGIRAEVADDGTIIFRKDRSVTAYALNIIHDKVTQSEFEELVDFTDTNGFGPHTFTLHGIDFVITLINEPEQADRKGELYVVVSKAIGAKA